MRAQVGHVGAGLEQQAEDDAAAFLEHGQGVAGRGPDLERRRGRQRGQPCKLADDVLLVDLAQRARADAP